MTQRVAVLPEHGGRTMDGTSGRRPDDRGSRRVPINTGHSPFAARPDLIATARLDVPV